MPKHLSMCLRYTLHFLYSYFLHLFSGANPTALNGKGELALHLAARQGHDKTLEVLLQHYNKIGHGDLVNAFPKAPPQSNENMRISQSNALHSASFHGHERCVEILLKFGATHLSNGAELYPIHIAAKQKHVVCLRIMIAHGDKDLVSMLCGNEYNALQHVCMATHTLDRKAIACACVLINAGIEVNVAPSFDERLCPLYLAARNGARELVYYFLLTGILADIEANFNERLLANARVSDSVRAIKQFRYQPLTLQIASRIAIRRHVQNGGMANVFKLPLPRVFQNYVFHGHADTDGLCDP